MFHIKNSDTKNAIDEHLKGLHKKVNKAINSSKLPKYLKAFLLANSREILIGEPKKLVDINNQFLKTIKGKKSKIIKAVKEIFNYTNFTTKKIEYNAYNLAENLGINVCPYCNREHTATVTGRTKEEQLTRPEFDHYLLISKHPLLGISFHNLIPSCKICNSTFKGTIEMSLTDHLHPYIDNLVSDIIFDYNNTVLPNGRRSIEITAVVAKSKDQARIEETLKLFKVKEVYNAHKYIIEDIIERRDSLNADYLEILANHTYTGLATTQKQLYYIAFGSYLDQDDFYKRPFSKLIFDVLTKESLLDYLPNLPI